MPVPRACLPLTPSPRHLALDVGAADHVGRDVLRALPGTAYLVFDHDLRFVFAEGAALRAGGFDPASVEGRRLDEVLGSAAAVLEPVYRRALGGETVELDVERHGEIHRVRAGPVRDERGAIVGGTLLSVDVTAGRRAEEALRASRERSRTLGQALDGVDDWFLLLDHDWRCRYLNEAAARGLTMAAAGDAPALDLIGRVLWDELPDALGVEFERNLRRAAATGDEVRFEHHHAPLDAWLLVSARAVEGGVLAWAQDVTELHRSNDRLERVAANVPGLVYQLCVGADGTPTVPYLSEGARRYGLDPRAVRDDARTLLELVHPDDRDAFWLSAADSSSRLSPWRWEGRLMLGDGEVRWVQLAARPERHGDGSTLWDGLLIDVTRARTAEETVRWHAQHDAVTRLPNRAAFLERVRHALTQAVEREERVAVCFVDLDRFKQVNDRLGHAVGDEVLRIASERIAHSLRPSDTVARFGSDELVVLLPTLPNRRFAALAGERIVKALRRPIRVGGHELAVSCSVGVAVGPDDGSEPESLVRHSEAAMYRAKQMGRARLQVSDPELAERARERVYLANDLRQAVEREELLVAYQPQLDVASGRVTAVEALLRWQHPDRGPIPPSVFIPLGEEHGLIERLGGWVLRRSCRQAAEWLRAGEAVRVSVNISPRQLQGGGLLPLVRRALRDARLPAGLLELELTESALIEQGEEPIAVLRELRALGVRISLDDFGTGYSSLAYLRRLPLDAVKTDRSFAGELDAPSAESIVRAIVDLSHALQLEVVAEGVETQQQRRVLEALGCDRLQGFLIGRPEVVNGRRRRHARGRVA